MKPIKGLNQNHSSNSKIGKGDSYGTGVKNPMGKTLDSSMNLKTAISKHLKKPPKSLA